MREQTGEEIFFKIKMTTSMGKVFDVYAARKGIQAESLRFMLDGGEMLPSDTAWSLELDDQDQIDCARFFHMIPPGH